jgi:hypothetical protein
MELFPGSTVHGAALGLGIIAAAILEMIKIIKILIP